jgi:hypothetical protein
MKPESSTGRFALIADLDTETTPAPGQFLIDLADRQG